METPPDILDQPADRATLHRLYAANCLPPQAWQAGVRRLQPKRDWPGWTGRVLLLLGATLVLAGVVFFFAYNGAKMHPFLKFGILEAGLAAALVGAWVAAGFLLGGFFLITRMESELGMLVSGLVFVAAATGLRRASRHIFLSQFCLALSLAGEALALAGLGMASKSLFVAALGSIVLCAALYPLYGDPLHRFLSCSGAHWLAFAWVMSSGNHHGIHVLVMAEVLATGWLFLWRPARPAMWPLGYSLAASLVGTLVFLAIPGDLKTSDWPSRVAVVGGLYWAVIRISGGWRRIRREVAVVAAVGCALVAAFSVSGILIAIGLLVVGYARGDRILIGLGILALPAFLFIFYYCLQVDLQTKSLILPGTGLVLLAARAWMLRRPWARRRVA